MYFDGLVNESEQYRSCEICQDVIISDICIICSQCDRFVHHECLKMAVLSSRMLTKEMLSNCICIYCGSEVHLQVTPSLGFVARNMALVYRKSRLFYKTAFNCLILATVNQTLVVLGVTTLGMIYGEMKANEILTSLNTVHAVSLCQLVSLIPVVISCSNWEILLLKGLRRCSHLPVLGCMFPREYPHVRETQRRRRRVPLGGVVDGLLVPIYAYVLGFLLNPTADPGLRRFVLGAVAFYSVRGTFYMFCRQKRYARLAGDVTVANYNEF